jgi:ERCC4-related helicase
MLQEGQNLVDIQAGIIIQLDGEERTFVQRFGRSMRAEDPVQFIFYYKGTRDEEYLENALQDIDKQYITVIEDLNDFNL